MKHPKHASPALKIPRQIPPRKLVRFDSNRAAKRILLRGRGV